jgi:hypothetical protein
MAMTRDEAAAKIREGANHLGGYGKGNLARELNHVADAVQTGKLSDPGEPMLWSGG